MSFTTHCASAGDRQKMRKRKGKVAERLKASVLKTEGAKASVGSNPTLSAPTSKYTVANMQKIIFALGMARALLYKFTRPLPTQIDEQTLTEIDKIISEICYDQK